MNSITEETLDTLEQHILDIETIMESEANFEEAGEFMQAVDNIIQDLVKHINEHTPKVYVERLQLCAIVLQKLAQKGQGQLDDIKEQILEIKNRKRANKAYAETGKG